MNVNKDMFENQWEQIRAQSKVWWSLFSEEDLEKVEKAPIKRDKYAMLLRVKYGYTHERAREEISRRLIDLDANPPSSELMHASLDQQASSKVSKVRKSQIKKIQPVHESVISETMRKMGRKGVSKPKPKKSATNENNGRGSSNSRPGESLSPVQLLVNTNDAPLRRGSTNPSAASNKKN